MNRFAALGELKVIAVTSPERNPILPDVEKFARKMCAKA